MTVSSGFYVLERDFTAILANRQTGSREREDNAVLGDRFPEMGKWDIEVCTASVRIQEIAILVHDILKFQEASRSESVAKGEGLSHHYCLACDMLATICGLAQINMRKMAIDLRDTALPNLPFNGRFALCKGWKVVYSGGATKRPDAFAMDRLVAEPAGATG